MEYPRYGWQFVLEHLKKKKLEFDLPKVRTLFGTDRATDTQCYVITLSFWSIPSLHPICSGICDVNACNDTRINWLKPLQLGKQVQCGTIRDLDGGTTIFLEVLWTMRQTIVEHFHIYSFRIEAVLLTFCWPCVTSPVFDYKWMRSLTGIQQMNKRS